MKPTNLSLHLYTEDRNKSYSVNTNKSLEEIVDYLKTQSHFARQYESLEEIVDYLKTQSHFARQYDKCFIKELGLEGSSYVIPYPSFKTPAKDISYWLFDISHTPNFYDNYTNEVYEIVLEADYFVYYRALQQLPIPEIVGDRLSIYYHIDKTINPVVKQNRLKRYANYLANTIIPPSITSPERVNVISIESYRGNKFYITTDLRES
jgi:hypothetical protein